MPIVVASVPAGHVYVRHVASSEGTADVVRLPDPPPQDGSAVEPWWPPRMLDPAWVEAQSATFDVMHIHFGFDARSPEDLSRLTEALRRHGRPLVMTVHDLRNPHHAEAGLHDAQLDVLVPAAAQLITLTSGAAAQIRSRWGREAHVLPHPHVVGPAWMTRPRPPRREFVIGLHAKSLRASIDPVPVVDALVRAVTHLPDARLVVDAHTDIMTSGSPRFASDVADHLRGLQSRGALDLHVHDYYSDDELWAYLHSLDLSVLPYRFGTHSGWLEACYDLGTTVLVPDCGFYPEQRPCLVYPLGPDGSPDVSGVVAAVRQAYAERPAWRADPAQRAAERRWLAAEHTRIYRAALEAA